MAPVARQKARIHANSAAQNAACLAVEATEEEEDGRGTEEEEEEEGMLILAVSLSSSGAEAGGAEGRAMGKGPAVEKRNFNNREGNFAPATL